MNFPESLMAPNERVVLHKHPHWKVLALPTLLFVVIIAGGSFLTAWVGKWNDAGLTSHGWWYLGIAIGMAIALVACCVVPWLRWKAEHFVLTSAHVFFRTGIFAHRLHQIPLSRVQDVETVVTFWGRLLRYGSLIVDSAADEPLEFTNVADVTRVQGLLNRLIAADRSAYPDREGDGWRVAGEPGDVPR